MERGERRAASNNEIVGAKRVLSEVIGGLLASTGDPAFLEDFTAGEDGGGEENDRNNNGNEEIDIGFTPFAPSNGRANNSKAHDQ